MHRFAACGHIVGCNTESEVLRHPDRHLIIPEVITKKLLEVVDVLGVPNRSPWHLRKLVAPLRLRNRYLRPLSVAPVMPPPPRRRKVGSIMTVGVITIPETMLARDVARLMHSNRINRVPVVREGTLLATRLAAYP
jgi:CBS domain-containing protein